jgi:hypothetical protein
VSAAVTSLPPRPRLFTLLIASLLAGSLAAGGCYRRVVGVKGDGYSGPVYEANLSEGERNAVVELFEVRSVRPADPGR